MSKLVMQPSFRAVGQNPAEWETFEKPENKRQMYGSQVHKLAISNGKLCAAWRQWHAQTPRDLSPHSIDWDDFAQRPRALNHRATHLAEANTLGMSFPGWGCGTYSNVAEVREDLVDCALNNCDKSMLRERVSGFLTWRNKTQGIRIRVILAMADG